MTKMPPSSVPALATPDRIIPDCCNTGVIFRSLLSVNAVILIACVVRANGLFNGIGRFLEVSMLVEASCLLSLVALCAVRRPAERAPAVVQRLLCIVLPAFVAAAITAILSQFDGLGAHLSSFAVSEAALVAGAFGGALQHYFALRMRAFSPAILEARLQALQARIRPHFLFNTLNAVLSLIRTEPRRAEETLQDLADTFRIFMRDAREMTTLEGEIEFCRKYLAIEQVRLGERLQVVWNTAGLGGDALRRGRMPALLLQPLIENAVHYGIEPGSEPATITITLTRSIDRIEIVVTNPYHDGMVAASDGNHMALTNIRERLALLYDVEGSLATQISQGVFEARLRFPYVKHNVRGDGE